MRVLFWYRGAESLGVQYLSSALKAAGHATALWFDPGLDATSYSDTELRFLRPLNRHDRLLRGAAAFDPDVVAFSVPSNLYPFAKAAARRLRRALPRAKFVIGGLHPTILPEFVLEDEPGLFDAACVGEAEEAFVEYLERLETGSPRLHETRNFAFRVGGETIVNPLRPWPEDLDKLPFPDKELFWRAGSARHWAAVITARGCPYGCTYCFNRGMRDLYGVEKKYLRWRSVGNVIEELALLKRRYPIEYFWFVDDIFTLSPKWLREFADLYRREIALPFDCQIHPNFADPERIELLKEAGCAHIFLGIDSGDEAVREEIMRRNTPTQHLLNVTDSIRRAGVRFTISFIFGLPGEDEAAMWRNVDLACRIRPDGVSSYVFYPYYGTEAYRESVRAGLLAPEDVERIKQGAGNCHGATVLRHPHAALANTLSKALPLYAKTPAWLRPLLDLLVRRRMSAAADVLYIALSPLLFPLVGLSWLRDYLAMAWRAQVGAVPGGGPERGP